MRGRSIAKQNKHTKVSSSWAPKLQIMLVASPATTFSVLDRSCYYRCPSSTFTVRAVAASPPGADRRRRIVDENQDRRLRNRHNRCHSHGCPGLRSPFGRCLRSSETHDAQGRESHQLRLEKPA